MALLLVNLAVFGGFSIASYRFSKTAFISAPTKRVRQETKIQTISTKKAPIAPYVCE
jgi:hypothetical protein